MKYPLIVTRVRNWSGAYVMTIPPALRESLHFEHGDLIALKVYGNYMVACRWPAPKVADLSQIPIEALPPLTPKGLKNGGATDNRA